MLGHLDWLTIAFAVIILWSAFTGAARGFGTELITLVLQVGYLASGVVAVWLAWRWMNAATHQVAGWNPSKWPNWLNQAVSLWQSSPEAARVIAFIVFYLVVAAVLRSIIVRPIATLLQKMVPPLVARNRVLGGGIGVLAGIVRCIMLGAVVFGVLHFYAVPLLTKVTRPSNPYQYLSSRVYQPYLSPVLDKELPVLGQDAAASLSKNISLFVVPSGPSEQARGVLIVPKQISDLARAIVKGQTTDEGKAKALYEWEIHHISYDWKKYQDYVQRGQWDAQTPLDTLRTGKGVCADYALLYAEMAHAVELTVQIDEGVGGTPSDNGSHAWNKVYLSETKQWIPVDTTWGAEQDEWFNAPHFNATHVEQKAIVISGGTA